MSDNVTRIRDYGGDVRQRIASLETQMLNVAHSVEKIETRVDTHYQTLHSRISDMRDELRQDIDDKHEKLIAKLDEHAKSESETNKSMSTKISAMEKWRWMIMGGAIVVGYIIAHVKLDKLI
jgi:predicted  nucleic acid-binding Zn-ribbon protein